MNFRIEVIWALIISVSHRQYLNTFRQSLGQFSLLSQVSLNGNFILRTAFVIPDAVRQNV